MKFLLQLYNFKHKITGTTKTWLLEIYIPAVVVVEIVVAAAACVAVVVEWALVCFMTWSVWDLVPQR